jgi:prolyl-tRNA synthetase
MSWRMLGAIIMTHGDDRGLRLPPKIAPYEAVFVPIVKGGNEAAVQKAHELAKALRAAGRRVRVDDRDYSPGWKYAEWEMRGVPLRIEIGPKDLESGSAVVVRRDKTKGDDGAKTVVPFEGLNAAVVDLLAAVHDSLFAQATHFLLGHTYKVLEREQFYAFCKERAGMVDIPWCERPACEADVKAATGATTRNMRPLETPDAPCVACGEPAKVNAYFAQSY